MSMTKGQAPHPVFTTQTLDGDHVTVHRNVSCRSLGRAIALETCTACPGFVGLVLGPDDAPGVRCRAAGAARTGVGEAADEVPVTQILRARTTCVAPDAELEVATSLLVELDLGALVVVDDEQHPVGVITTSDLVREREGVGADLPLRVRDVMAPVTLSVADWTSVARAASLMAEAHLHHLPVVGQDGRVVGVVTALDILAWLARHAAGDDD